MRYCAEDLTPEGNGLYRYDQANLVSLYETGRFADGCSEAFMKDGVVPSLHLPVVAARCRRFDAGSIARRPEDGTAA